MAINLDEKRVIQILSLSLFIAIGMNKISYTCKAYS